MTKPTLWPHWSDVPTGAWLWPHFTPEEMACRGSGKILIIPEFMDRLERLRVALDFAFPVHSGFRSLEYNKQIGGGVAHPTGEAGDIRAYGLRAFKLIEAAPRFGFIGLGVSQKSSTPHRKRFIHLDTLESGPDLPRPRLWSY